MSAELLIQRKGATATIQRASQSVDNAGAYTLSYSTHLSGITVYLQDKSGSETIRYGRENVRRFAVAYVKAGYDIRENDRLVIGSRTFDIQHVRTRGVGRTLQMVLEAEETLP